MNEEGRAMKVEGDPSQPVTQGFLCGKVAKYLDRVGTTRNCRRTIFGSGTGHTRGPVTCTRAWASAKNLAAANNQARAFQWSQADDRRAA